MKKTLLIGAAALSLATGTAHAQEWQCGKVNIEMKKLTSDHLAELRIEAFLRDLLIKKGEFKFEMSDEGGVKLNGKRCQEIKGKKDK